MSKSVGKLTSELTINTEEFQKLVALCLEQTKLIVELHEQVYDNSALDSKVEKMFDNIREMRLDEYLSEIRYEAFCAGIDDVDGYATEDESRLMFERRWGKSND